MIDKIFENLTALANGADNAPKILSSGFYVLDVTREYTERGTMLKVSAQGEIKNMPFELADEIVGEGQSDSHTSDDGCIFYPVTRAGYGTVVTVVGVDKKEADPNE
jgi:hypothetical protein